MKVAASPVVGAIKERAIEAATTLEEIVFIVPPQVRSHLRKLSALFRGSIQIFLDFVGIYGVFIPLDFHSGILGVRAIE